MTQEQKITAIENKIRGEVPRLMELTMGCEVKFPDGQVYMAMGELENGGISFYVKEDKDYFTTDLMEVDGHIFEDGKELEILGHPIQLSDLLYVIQQKWIFNSFVKGYEFYPVFRIEKCEYDLTKSFKENLETNPVLTDSLFNLICTK